VLQILGVVSDTMELKDKVAIIGIGLNENKTTKMKKTLTILHSGFFQTNFLAGIQNTASSICSEYRSSLQNEVRNLGGKHSEINRQTILLNQ
jgi:hypothetical protein